MRVKARADSRQMQIPAKWSRADQSVHAQSYHSICRSYTPDGKQDICIRKFSKLSIMLTSPAVPYALAAVKIEPLQFLQVTRWFCGGDRGGFAVGKIAVAEEA